MLCAALCCAPGVTAVVIAPLTLSERSVLRFLQRYLHARDNFGDFDTVQEAAKDSTLNAAGKKASHNRWVRASGLVHEGKVYSFVASVFR